MLQDGVFSLSDKEIQMLVEAKTIPAHQLEKFLKDPCRAVKIRYLIFTTLRDCFCLDPSTCIQTLLLLLMNKMLLL